jgi:hypothetical protein
VSQHNPPTQPVGRRDWRIIMTLVKLAVWSAIVQAV